MTIGVTFAGYCLSDGVLQAVFQLFLENFKLSVQSHVKSQTEGRTAMSVLKKVAAYKCKREGIKFSAWVTGEHTLHCVHCACTG